jgi:hypothetical protein
MPARAVLPSLLAGWWEDGRVQKIPTLFQRDWDGDRRFVTREITPGCEWVAKGEGTPTRDFPKP